MKQETTTVTTNPSSYVVSDYPSEEVVLREQRDREASLQRQLGASLFLTGGSIAGFLSDAVYKFATGVDLSTMYSDPLDLGFMVGAGIGAISALARMVEIYELRNPDPERDRRRQENIDRLVSSWERQSNYFK